MHPTAQSEAVSVRPRRKWPGYLPLCVLPASAIAFARAFPAWAYMWTIAFSLYVSVKWLAWSSGRATPHSAARSFAFVALWPGMDADSFLDETKLPPKPSAGQWLAAVLKTALGAALLWFVVRQIPPQQSLLRGWTGMVGIIFLLHFGSFDVLARFWQARGVWAEPIMQSPARSKSLSEFWGKRWNLGFRKLSHDFVFKPAQRRFGVAGATMLVFAASGIIHELVISVPARAGYGLPTAYFVLQGLGVLAERSSAARTPTMNAIRGRIWTILVAAGPAYLLFHPWFVARVILPFLAVMGAV